MLFFLLITKRKQACLFFQNRLTRAVLFRFLCMMRLANFQQAAACVCVQQIITLSCITSASRNKPTLEQNFRFEHFYLLLQLSSRTRMVAQLTSQSPTLDSSRQHQIYYIILPNCLHCFNVILVRTLIITKITR